jgi:hypothetical protein
VKFILTNGETSPVSTATFKVTGGGRWQTMLTR